MGEKAPVPSDPDTSTAELVKKWLDESGVSAVASTVSAEDVAQMRERVAQSEARQEPPTTTATT